jgi:hypothetical protein
MWYPGAEGHILTENTSFGGFSAGLHCKNFPAAVGGIPVSERFAAIFAGLEHTRLRYPALYAGRTKLCVTQILPPYVRPSLRNGPASGGISTQDPPLFPLPPLSRC